MFAANVILLLLLIFRNEFNPIFSCWEVVLWLRIWKKSLLYTAFSVVFFLWPHGLWLSNVAGSRIFMNKISNNFKPSDIFQTTNKTSFLKDGGLFVLIRKCGHRTTATIGGLVNHLLAFFFSFTDT